MQKRQKASDVFRESEFLIAEKTSDFAKAFPDIATVKVQVTEEGHFPAYDRSRTRTYTQGEFGEYIDCSNPLCHNGGIRIGQQLRAMQWGRQPMLEEMMFCQGKEGSPKGRRVYGPCMNSFKIKVEVSYRAGNSED